MGLMDHIKRNLLMVDTQGRFLFMANRKVCVHSVARHLLADRVILRKDAPSTYERTLNKLYGKDDIDHMFKFTIVRNPWDRVVSAFFANVQSSVRRTRFRKFTGGRKFGDFVKQVLVSGTGFDSHFDHQHNKAYYMGKQYVDFVGRFEDLARDWGYIASVIGCSAKLPHRNRSRRDYDYRNYYDETSAAIVSDLYADDIRLFNYKF